MDLCNINPEYNSDKKSACHRSPLKTVYCTLLASLHSVPFDTTDRMERCWLLRKGHADGNDYGQTKTYLPAHTSVVEWSMESFGATRFKVNGQNVAVKALKLPTGR